MRYGQGLETKSADDDESDVTKALATLTKSVSDKTDELDKKIANMDGLLTDIAKKMNRPGGVVLRTDGIEVKADQADLHKALDLLIRKDDFRELKAMSVGSDPDGGYLVHPVLSQTIRQKLFDLNPMRRLAHTETIGAGDAWEEPFDDSDIPAGWVGETDPRPETGTPQVGGLRIPVEEVYCMPKVTERLIEDSSYNVGAWLENKIGDKFGRMEADAGVLGDGIKKPRGFLRYDKSPLPDSSRPRATLQTIASGYVTTFKLDSLKKVVWSLRSPFKANATWLMNSMTASIIDGMEDGMGRPLWRDSNTAGVPGMLLGHPIALDESMPDVAAGAYPIAFGDFRAGYQYVDKPGIKILPDRLTQKPHVLFYARRRTGGGLRDSEAIKLMMIGA